MQDKLNIAGREFSSRLLVGTGRYKSMAEMQSVIDASGAEIVTVAVRRVNLGNGGNDDVASALDPKRYTYLPNSAGCYSAEDAVRCLRLARELGDWTLVKLEVIGDEKTLLPDTAETLKAAKLLVAEGFEVMAYTNDDPIAAKKLEDAGCVAVMPLGAPIGSGLGIQNPLNIRLIVELSQADWPLSRKFGCDKDMALRLLDHAKSLGLDPIGIGRCGRRDGLRRVCCHGAGL